MQTIKKDKNYWQAVAVMIGYIVGVGMFSLPFLVARSGWLVFIIWFVVLGAVQHLVHLIYASVINANPGYHRLPGYVYKYLGYKGMWLAFLAKIFGNYGSILAYLIISSIFLQELLSPFFQASLFFYVTAMFLFGAFVVYNGIKAIAKVELYMSILLFMVVGLMAWKGFDAINPANYQFFNWHNFLLPYGAMLVALDGIGSLPIVARMVKKDPRVFKSVIRSSMLLSSIILIVFVFVVVGISGLATTPDALLGIRSVLTNSVITFALLFGLLSMLTSLFGVSEAIKETLAWDFKINEKVSWFLAIIVPYVLYLSGVRDFIGVISFIGAVGGGVCIILLLTIFLKMKKQKMKLSMFARVPSNAVIYSLMFMFFLGIVYTILGL